MRLPGSTVFASREWTRDGEKQGTTIARNISLGQQVKCYFSSLLSFPPEKKTAFREQQQTSSHKKKPACIFFFFAARGKTHQHPPTHVRTCHAGHGEVGYQGKMLPGSWWLVGVAGDLSRAFCPSVEIQSRADGGNSITASLLIFFFFVDCFLTKKKNARATSRPPLTAPRDRDPSHRGNNTRTSG